MVQFSSLHKELGGYIYLPDAISGELPKSIEVKDNRLLLKSEFHITLVNAGDIATIINQAEKTKIDAEIMDEFKDFIKEFPLEEYRVIKKFRLVHRDIRRSVIIMAEVPHLDDFFKRLGQKYQKEIPIQPTHITLYTLQPEKGIGVSSEDELKQDSVPIEISELQNLRFGKKAIK